MLTRRTAAFELSLRLNDPGFVPTPDIQQRNWILNRTLDEFSDDVSALDRIARGLVNGSRRPEIQGQWETQEARFSDSDLVIAGQQVMQDWERPLMDSMAEIAAGTHGDVLEIGFGMGISASFIQERGVRSHTIVECNDDVIEHFHQWRAGYADADIRLIRGRWRSVLESLETYDSILFDAYPLDESEFMESVIEQITFAQAFFPAAAKLLRPGGVLTYYTNEIDSLSRRHQRCLFEFFRSLTVSVQRNLRPPADCNYWWANSMAVVAAIK